MSKKAIIEDSKIIKVEPKKVRLYFGITSIYDYFLLIIATILFIFFGQIIAFIFLSIL